MNIGEEKPAIEVPMPLAPGKEQPIREPSPVVEPVKEPAKAIQEILNGEMTLTEWQEKVVNSILGEARRG